MVGLCLLEIHFGKTKTRLSRTERSHIGDNLQLGNHFAFLDHFSSLFIQFGYDAVDLRLDIHLIARLYLTGHHRCPGYVHHTHRKFLPGYDFRTGLRIQEHECSDKNQCHQCKGQILENLFHIYSLYIFL